MLNLELKTFLIAFGLFQWQATHVRMQTFCTVYRRKPQGSSEIHATTDRHAGQQIKSSGGVVWIRQKIR